MSETQQNAATPEAPANPLLRPWQTPFETPPFAEISPEHFLPAFERAFADHSAEVAAITHDPSAPIRIAAEMTVMTLGQMISLLAPEEGCMLMK